jgi:hypothetical protein
LACTAALAGGCATIDSQFTAEGFVDRRYGFRVAYADPAARTLMDANWILDNFVFNDDGSPQAEKGAQSYLTSLAFDVDGDGEMDTERDMRLYELRFVHRRDGGVIWMRTIPVADRFAQTDLRLLAHDYVEEVAGGDYYAVRLAGQSVVEDVRFATAIVDEGETAVDEQSAYRVTFDVANVDQLRLDPNSRSARVRLVLVRPPYRSRVSVGRDFHDYATLVAVGYSNAPEYFDAHAAEFDTFLTRLELVPPSDGAAP